MKIRIKTKEDMLPVIQKDNRYAHTYNKTKVEYHAMLGAIAGQVIDVETDYLFSDQYNTPPIEGVSDIGLRVFDRYVSEVIDDIRPGMVKCGWCGNSYLDTGAYCHSTEYIRPLLPTFYRRSQDLYRARGYDWTGAAY